MDFVQAALERVIKPETCGARHGIWRIYVLHVCACRNKHRLCIMYLPNQQTRGHTDKVKMFHAVACQHVVAWRHDKSDGATQKQLKMGVW